MEIESTQEKTVHILYKLVEGARGGIREDIESKGRGINIFNNGDK